MRGSLGEIVVELLKKLLARQSLSFEESRQLLKQIQEDTLTDEQLRSVLLALRVKGETPDEIAGFASVMQENALAVSPRSPIVVDTAGTGGDGLNTFNISTTAAFIIAGAGIPVAKHGNRAVSSRSGSADLMDALGVELDLIPQATEKCLNEIGIAFFFAPKFHRATARVAKVRSELGIKTIFNLLGPLTNPARVKRQVIGVCGPEIAQRMAAVCQRLGREHVWVVSGDEGVDEISICGPTHVSEIKNGKYEEYEIVPEDFGFVRGDMEDLQGGDAKQNASHLIEILTGDDQSSRRDVVLLNAAAGVYVAGADSFESALHQAQNSLDNGYAYEKLQQLIETSKRLKETLPIPLENQCNS